MASTKSEKTLDEAGKTAQDRENGCEPIDQQSCQLPRDRLATPIKRLVLLFTGSFNPVTIAHLRLLELARDYYHERSIQILEGIISPVSDCYAKAGLATVNYRIEMLQAAIRGVNWLRIDTWEAEQTSWTRTKVTLDHHHEYVKKRYGENTGIRFLSGADVVRSMLNPKIWIPKDIDDIMTKYGVVCINRLTIPEAGQSGATVSDIKDGMSDLWKENIDVIQDWVVNDISATNIRNRLEKGCSVKYIVPDATIEIIRKYGLYNSNKSICLADWPYNTNKCDLVE